MKKVAYDHDIKEKKLNMHELYANYTEAEKKFSLNESTIYNMHNYILTKSKDMNYEQHKQECIGLIDELNKMTLKTSAWLLCLILWNICNLSTMRVILVLQRCWIEIKGYK